MSAGGFGNIDDPSSYLGPYCLSLLAMFARYWQGATMCQGEPTPEAAMKTQTYTNPVYKGYFAAPFVWEHQGVYYAIGTGAAEAKGEMDEIADATHIQSTEEVRVFPLLYSQDFVNWQSAGNALPRPDPALGNNYWAPEADNVLGPYSDAGNDAGPRVLRSLPGRVLGPGHNSIVRGPDGQTEYIVYHAWDTNMEARRMCLDPLVWTPSGPRCNGPTWTPQTLVRSNPF